MSDPPEWNITDPSSQENKDLLPKIKQDRYKVLSMIGHGGMGIVLKASHAQLNKLVAIKVLNANLLTDTESIKRFEIEAKAGSQLSHPNLISVFDYGLTEDGQPYLVMEYVEGQSLHDLLLEKGPLDKELFVDIFIQTTKALQYVHKHNIIHRDLKPSNIMIQQIDGDMYAKLLDFGVAKVLADSGMTMHNLTETGTAFGSPLYMSPEQCMGKEIEATSDIYSMGCVMYQCVVGTPPVVGANALETIHMQANGESPPLIHTDSNDAAMNKIAYIIYKALKKKTIERFQSSSELLKELEEVKHTLDSLKFSGANPIADSEKSMASNRWKIPNKPGAYQSTDDHTKEITGKQIEESLNMESDSQDTKPNRVGSDISEIELRQLTTQSLRKKDVMNEGSFDSKPNNLKKIMVSSVVLVLFAGVAIVSYPIVQASLSKYNQKKSIKGAELAFSKGQIGYQRAKRLYIEALDSSRSSSNKLTTGKILTRLGTIYLSERDATKAMQHYSEALELLKDQKQSNKELYIQSLVGLGLSFQQSEEFEKASKPLNEAEKLQKTWTISPELKGDLLKALASNQASQNKEPQKALALYDEAIKEYSKSSNDLSEKIANTWLDSAELSLKSKFEKDGIRRAKQALALASKVKVPHTKNEIERRAQPIANLDKQTANTNLVNTMPVAEASSTSLLELEKDKAQQEGALAKLELERIKRAKKAAQELAKFQKENARKTSEMLRKMSKSAKSANDYSRPRTTTPTSINNLKEFSKSFVEK